jgi:long-chain acyl-CoA synthetase
VSDPAGVQSVGAQRPTWLFDVDATLVDGVTGSHLRPHARHLLELLRGQGARTLLWSSGGAEYALRRARQHAIDHLVDGVFDKRRGDTGGPWDLPPELRNHPPTVLVDDVPSEVPTIGEVVAVRPFLGPNPHDNGLVGLLQRLLEATMRPSPAVSPATVSPTAGPAPDR